MIEIIKYQCQYCKKIYDTKEACQQCEDSHGMPLTVEDTTLEYEESTIFPQRLYIKNTKGNRALYKIERIITEI